MGSPQPRYAGFWIRLVAHLIDTAIVWAVSWMLELAILGVLFWVSKDPAPFSDYPTPFAKQMIDGFLELAIAVPYYVIGHVRYGTTLGKYPLGIYVVSANGHGTISLKQSWIRCLSYVLSYLPLGAGFLMAALHPEKRALHDLLAGTVSIIRRERGLPAVEAAPVEKEKG